MYHTHQIIEHVLGTKCPPYVRKIIVDYTLYYITYIHPIYDYPFDMPDFFSTLYSGKQHILTYDSSGTKINSKIYNQTYIDCMNAFIDFFPKDVSELIYSYVMHQYKYMFSISCSKLFDKIYFNEQLELICYYSGTSYGIIDSRVGNQYISLLFDVKNISPSNDMNCVSRYYKNQDNSSSIDIKNIMYSIIHYDNTCIVYRDNNYIIKYIICNHKYVLAGRLKIKIVDAYICIYNQYVYIFEDHGAMYNITIYDLENLDKVIHRSFSISSIDEDDRITYQMSIHNNIIYIIKPRSVYSFWIYSHDANTLGEINTRILVCNSSSLITKLYGDKIYNYVPNKIIVYSIKTLRKLYTSELQPFKKSNSNNRLSISNGVMMVSNDTEMMFYLID
jgi:hypothetical protein